MAKKLFILLIILCMPVIIKSQVLKERRVYYLDCSYSMKQNGIWDLVREELKSALDNIHDETTEILVCPYAFDTKSTVKVHREYATPKGIAKLKSIIDGFPMTKSTKTYHEMPLREFYKNGVANNRVTYVFFMTDGVSDHIQEDKNYDPFPSELAKWHSRYKDKHVYGFYVMLHEKATEYKEALKVIGDEEDQRNHHLWAYNSASVNINSIRLNNTATFNAKNEEYFEIPIYGKYEGKTFEAKFPVDSKIKITKSYIQDGKLKVHAKVDGDIHSLPELQTLPLTISMNGGGKFDFLITSIVNVKCVRKPERTLKISFR